jgi:1,4-dihydroxy-2-naphthoyl-CoA synthase
LFLHENWTPHATVDKLKLQFELRKNPIDRNLNLAKQMVEACFASEDYKDGRKAFAEERTPVFKGH